jgi:serine/threonine-protein kinase
MSDVFVSYKAEDRRRVKPLVDALESEGYSVWWDEQIGGGATWRHAIEAELNSAKCVIVAWSKRSVGEEGTFVQDEATRAQQRHVYVPVLLDKVHLPLGFGETQALPLSGWKGDRADSRYRAILAAVERITGAKSNGATAPETRAKHHHVDRRAVLAGGAAATAAVVGVGGWTLLKPTSASAASDSIAVLPFANLSGDPAQAYFSDGIAEEIRSALARLGRLRVVARTSSEIVRDMDAKAAAHKLGVANVLTGSVRRSPSTIRVSAQLVDGQSGLERWSATYDRPFGDTLKIQSGIAENVAQALSVELGHSERAALASGGTGNAQAQDLVLRSNPGLLNGEDALRHGVDLLDTAIALDPNYADAWARKGLLLSFLASSFARSPADYREKLAQATAAAQKAVALAPDFDGGYQVLGEIARVQLDFKRALANFGRSETPSNNPGYALLLSQLGRNEDAWAIIKRAERNDPLNPGVFQIEARLLFNSRHYTEAIERARRANERDSNHAGGSVILAESLIALGRFDEASKSLQPMPSDDPYRLTDDAIIAAKRGDLQESERIIAELKGMYPNTVNYQLAQIYAQRNDPKSAFNALGDSWTYRDPGLARLKVDPFMDPIRSDPRYEALVRKLNFPS